MNNHHHFTSKGKCLCPECRNACKECVANVTATFDYKGYCKALNKDIKTLYLHIWYRNRIILIETLVIIGLIWRLFHV